MIDWSRVPPAIKQGYDEIADKLDDINREADLDSLKMLKDFRRSIIQDGILNDFEPHLDEIDEMIGRMVERLT